MSADPPGLDLAVELAHDVRSPIGAVIALAELLQTGACGPVTAAQKYQLHLMQQAARGISKLTHDVVDFGRLGTVDSRESIAPFRVEDVLKAVGEIVQPMVQSSGLKLIVRNFAPKQWLGCRAAVTRVMLNLVTNSLKYSGYGVVEFGARLLAADRLEFFVRDTGSGFDPNALHLGHSDGGNEGSERWKSASSGLGLAITRRLLHSMGSSLEIESRPGEGSNFRFTLTLPTRS